MARENDLKSISNHQIAALNLHARKFSNIFEKKRIFFSNRKIFVVCERKEKKVLSSI